MKMDEKNPLYFYPRKTCSEFNKSGRPTNENLIKFSPQPCSVMSQMLKQLKQENLIKSECDDSKVLTVDENDEYRDNEDETHRDSSNCDEGNPSQNDEGNDKLEVIDRRRKNYKKLIYECDYLNCKYTSKLLSNVVKHKRTHTMEKPYLCDQCTFRSNFVNSLKVHKRIHTNERPYCCNLCDYRCNSSSNLKKHFKHRHYKDKESNELLQLNSM